MLIILPIDVHIDSFCFCVFYLDAFGAYLALEIQSSLKPVLKSDSGTITITFGSLVSLMQY